MGLDNEFDDARTALQQADVELSEARRAERSAGLRLAAHPDDDALRDVWARAKRRLDETTTRRANAFAAYLPYSDPRTARLAEFVPMLLVPVRVETRFKGGDLCIRIYPDECSVDTFDTELSVAEVGAAARFWSEYWRAGGIEAEERAAFRTLSGAYGPARAKWVVAAYKPENPNEKPTKNPATDVVLVVAAAAVPTQKDALTVYWRAVWKAEGKPAALNSALTALSAAVGSSSLAAELIDRYRPFTLDEPPPPGLTHASTTVTVAWLNLPDDEGEPQHGWRRPPLAALMPERFLVTLYAGGTSRTVPAEHPVAEPLYVGPDPLAPEAERISVDDKGDLKFPDSLAWMFDFEKAKLAGMALRIRLLEHESEGFDRIVVVGLRTRSDPKTAAMEFGALLHGHGHSRAGVELLPQGTPTNNTDDAPSAWSRRDDPDLAFDDVFGPVKYDDSAGPLEQRDGAVFARLLGLDREVTRRMRGADGRDLLEARAMNTALAPGTLRYVAGVLMHPVFRGWVDELTWYYTTYVSGRGALSPLRIGGQPYGILASTAFSRIAWVDPGTTSPAPTARILTDSSPDSRIRFLRRMWGVLDGLEKHWIDASLRVSHVGDGNDPHQTLLDILGLHPGSAEFHSRRGKSLDEMSSRWSLMRFLGVPSEKYRAKEQRQKALALLRGLGYGGTKEPDLLDIFFRAGQSVLKGPLIEALPPSSTNALQDATADGHNYLEWLGDAAAASLDTLRRQTGFIGDRPPRTLLYIMAQFALERGYHDAGAKLRIFSGLLDSAAVNALSLEAKSVHLDPSAGKSDSPWARLYDVDSRFTGSQTTSIADHLTSVLDTRPDYAVDLAEQIDAVKLLVDTPTARLENALIEHIDTLSYRYDAWRLGLVRYQLDVMRGSGSPTGLYLGAYGWLEDVTPDDVELEEPHLSDELAEAFAGTVPLKVDPTNGGHIHTPSMNQAVTAAILRAGSLANRTTDQQNAFAVNLSSTRVRTATSLLEGVRSGQHLGGLLGYRFERALHNNTDGVELDALIYTFRRAFPLTADKLKPTQNPPPAATEALEARNVVDGLALVKQATDDTAGKYEQLLAGLGAAERTVVEKAVKELVEAFDAMADLVFAEGVHQAAQNNSDRAQSHLDIAADFTAPPAPRVVETPTTGFALTCRVALELDPAATAANNAAPRVKAQPALDKWLGEALPPMNRIGCSVTVDGVGAPITITLSQLGITAIDTIYLISDEGGGGFAELEDRILRYVVTAVNPRPDRRIRIDYVAAGQAATSVFVASAFTQRLRGIALKSRPLRAGDVVPPSVAEKPDKVAHVVEPARVSGVLADLVNVRTQLDAAIAAGAAVLVDPAANRVQLLSGIDNRIGLVADLLASVARFGGAYAGWGSLYTWRTSRFSDLLERVSALVDRWNERLASATKALADAAAAGTDAEKIRLLRIAEGYVSTAVAPETTPPTLRPVVVGKVSSFETKLTNIRSNALDAPNPGLAERLSRCQNILPLSDFDSTPVSFDGVADAIVGYWSQLQALLEAVRADVKKREDDAGAAMTDAANAADADGRLAALQAGAAAIFGEGFTLIPTFTLDTKSGAEQKAADAHGQAPDGLLKYAADTLSVDEPLDTWLYGCARVRTTMRLVEDATMLTEAHGRTIGRLRALQLPHVADAPWYAMDFPAAYTPDSERLSYVALARNTFKPDEARCGLLLDDWTETIPVIQDVGRGPTHTTGLAFNFDRPSQEPPQAMLLLTPATWTGAWAWDDIVTGIVDTFKLSRLRAVEPKHLDETELAPFLPATVASVTTTGLLSSANFGLLNVAATISRSFAGG